MSLIRIAAIALRHLYLFRASAARALRLFASVSIDIVVWGFISKYLNSVASVGFDFLPALLGAVLLWDFFSRVMFGITTAFLEDVWSRNFLNIFTTPLTISEYVAGLVLSTIGTSFVGLLVMILLASSVFGLSVLRYGFAIVPFILILFIFGVAMGTVGTAVVLRFGPAAEWFIWPLPALVSPFAAVFYPVATLPPWMRVTARLLPPSYVFENIRCIVQGKGVSKPELLVSGMLAVIYVGVAALILSLVFHFVVRTGLLARYSAESVT